jgi:hypothetical protein
MSNNPRISQLLMPLVLLVVPATPACVAPDDPDLDEADAAEEQQDEDEDEYTGTAHEALLAGDIAAWAHFDGFGLVASRSYNSVGGTNSIIRNGVGRYTVRLDGIYGNYGNAQVVAADGNHRCKLMGWGAALPYFDTTTVVNVQCHDPAGAPIDNRGFVVAYARFPGGTAPSASGAYVRMNQPAGGVIDAGHQFGSSATVTRWLTGQYTVNLPGQASNGNVQITAVGATGAEYCKSNGWGGDGAGGTNVHVSCYAPGGLAADSQFSLRYLRDTRDSWYGSGGYAWVQASGIVSPTYRRNLLSDEAGGGLNGAVTTTHPFVGELRVRYENLAPANGLPLVTPYGDVSDPSYCTLGPWTAGIGDSSVTSSVRCWNASGWATDSAFDHVYFSRSVIPG